MLVYLMDSRGTSTKTRIETYVVTDHGTPASQIREAHPLKQGLKPADKTISFDITDTIREAHPLKQGLKLHVVICILVKQNLFERHIH